MKLKLLFSVLILAAVRCKISSCVPRMMGDVDDERDVNFLINKIKDVIKKNDTAAEHGNNAIHFDGNGNSIDGKAPEEHQAEVNNQHGSSEVDHHAIRYDKHGNSLEIYKDSDEQEEEEEEPQEEQPRRKKKTKTPKFNLPEMENGDTINLNKILSENVVNKQLQMREMHSQEGLFDGDDDVPLITIPMVDILKQYQRMQQGFISETEEYSDETTRDVFSDPHLKDILHEIEEERRIGLAMANGAKDAKIKPAAKRVLERHGGGDSDDSL